MTDTDPAGPLPLIAPKLKGNAKARVQRLARRVLGSGSLPTLCERAAQHFNEVWDGKKASGYGFLVRIVGLPVDAPKPLKRPKCARFTPYNRGAAKASRATDVNSDEFLSSYAWRSLRMEVLTMYGARCQCCGATPVDGVRIHVDHIKPRRLFPALALERSNLQVLCEVCNHGKGNWDQTDWRTAETTFRVTPPASPEPFWAVKKPN